MTQLGARGGPGWHFATPTCRGRRRFSWGPGFWAAVRRAHLHEGLTAPLAGARGALWAAAPSGNSAKALPGLRPRSLAPRPRPEATPPAFLKGPRPPVLPGAWEFGLQAEAPAVPASEPGVPRAAGSRVAGVAGGSVPPSIPRPSGFSGAASTADRGRRGALQAGGRGGARGTSLPGCAASASLQVPAPGPPVSGVELPPRSVPDTRASRSPALSCHPFQRWPRAPLGFRLSDPQPPTWDPPAPLRPRGFPPPHPRPRKASSPSRSPLSPLGPARSAAVAPQTPSPGSAHPPPPSLLHFWRRGFFSSPRQHPAGAPASGFSPASPCLAPLGPLDPTQGTPASPAQPSLQTHQGESTQSSGASSSISTSLSASSHPPRPAHSPPNPSLCSPCSRAPCPSQGRLHEIWWPPAWSPPGASHSSSGSAPSSLPQAHAAPLDLPCPSLQPLLL